jgi:SulP family sulfate permease
VLLAFFVGLIQIGITLLRLGDLTRYISQAVIVGFTVGAAFLLLLDQLQHVLGLTGRGSPGDHFLKRFWLTLSEGGGIHLWSLAIALGTMALILVLRRLNQRLQTRRIHLFLPEYLTAVCGMAGLVWALGLDQRGVAVVGPILRTLPLSNGRS